MGGDGIKIFAGMGRDGVDFIRGWAGME